MTILEKPVRRILFSVVRMQYASAANSAAVRDESGRVRVLARVLVLDAFVSDVGVVDVVVVLVAWGKSKMGLAQVCQKHGTMIRSWPKQIAPMAQSSAVSG